MRLKQRLKLTLLNGKRKTMIVRRVLLLRVQLVIQPRQKHRQMIKIKRNQLRRRRKELI